MPSFSAKSLAQLETCHPDLQRLLTEVVKHQDCSVIEGRRDEATQNKYLEDGVTTLPWPSSKHNVNPPELSRAVDVVPYVPGIGQVWPQDDDPHDVLINKLKIFAYFQGYVKAVADELGIEIRQGIDWDGDRNFADQKFDDLPHIELK